MLKVIQIQGENCLETLASSHLFPIPAHHYFKTYCINFWVLGILPILRLGLVAGLLPLEQSCWVTKKTLTWPTPVMSYNFKMISIFKKSP
jgi:hypothetical protein